MKRIDIENIIRNGGATLSKAGACVNFARGYQVSKKDCYTLNVSNVRRILRAVNSLLNTVKPSEFVGLWVDAAGKIRHAHFIKVFDFDGVKGFYELRNTDTGAEFVKVDEARRNSAHFKYLFS